MDGDKAFVIVMVIGLLLLAAYCVGERNGINYSKRMAIKAKVATYVSDENGESKFVFLTQLTELEKPE